MLDNTPALVVNNTSSHTLNQDQENAAEAFFQFMFSDEKEFMISGPAGTGKTFLMQHIINDVLPEFQSASKLLGLDTINYEVVLTATTNKAAEVLHQSTGRETNTIHSHMNLKVVDDYKTGESKIKATNAWTVYGKQIVFIDEASMIDSALYKFILNGFDKTCKIVYLGDHCQMAPVFEQISPIYRDRKNLVLLNQPMRNSGQPALMNLCAELRNTVETLQFKPILEHPGVIDYVDGPQAQAWIDSTFNVEDPGARILCFSNDRVQEYNGHIRELRQYPSFFSKGENLINNSGIQVGSRFLKVEEEFVVKDLEQGTHNVSITNSDMELEVYTIKLGSPQGGIWITVRVPTDKDHFKELTRYFARLKNWSAYYFLKNNFPDLRQKDAATVYKAQGSTYDTVFLDLKNICQCTKNDQLARMLYVGASRARSRLILFGQLAPRLFKN